MSKTPISGKKRLFERALRELRTRILTGELAPDQSLPETAAADLIGISRTPTREAMAQLVEEGLLSRTDTGRYTVRHLTRGSIIDAIEYRGVMEGTVARLAAERGAVQVEMDHCRRIVADIDRVLDAGEAAMEFDAYTELNDLLHRHVARLSGSDMIEREVLRAHGMPLASPNAFLQSQMNVPAIRRSLYIAQAQHKALLDAVTDREGARAEAVAREHARLARANLDYVIYDNQSLAGTIPGLALISGDVKVTERPTRKHSGRTT